MFCCYYKYYNAAITFILFYKQLRLPTTRLNCLIIFNIYISVYCKIFKKKFF